MFNLSFVKAKEPDFNSFVLPKIKRVRETAATCLEILCCEKKIKKGWFGKVEELVPFEKWSIKLNYVSFKTELEHLENQKRIKKQLQDCLLYISVTCSENITHIPPITSAVENPFPFKINIPNSNESWGKLVKKLMTESSPTLG